MSVKQIDKKALKVQYLLPKTKLKEVRRLKKVTTAEIAKVIGVSREHYEKKEAGKYPFQDYEMILISQELGEEVSNLFF
ncbi:helix-turn-helix transcriptional regulator [Enterococcus faecalis]|uniref:helix-turn-helix transcriptional regulator n=1 Tax=Enterococcus faecalis TaxID=1351 RepID=UPI00033077B6|nr:transcriptional regulator [Enterococcus faecalis]EOJ20301.1 hypothetical protein UMS_00442 [Enterococcus faecalis EnGen0287]MCU2257772.1 transcriptional regulator [Enterococcus faecalis]